MDYVSRGISNLLAMEDVKVNNIVFRLHYKVTVVILLVFALVVVSKEHIGDPIECYIGKEHLEVIDKYCWIYSTYTVRERVQDNNKSYSKSSLDKHPGVGEIPFDSSLRFEEKIKYHKYYQWVGFILIFQALLFFIPHYVWKRCEGGRLKSLVLEVSHPTVDLTDAENHQGRISAMKVIQSIMQYWGHHLHYHDNYGFLYALCEFLNLANVVSQFYFLNFVVGGDLHSYIDSIFKSSEKQYQNVVERIFPKVAKCNFEYFGHSGSKAYIDALCVLPVNIVNEKIFAILWFWFITVSIISGIAVLYRVMCYFNYKLRLYLILSHTRSISECRVRGVVRKMHYGDWFLLYLMAKNMNHLALEKLLLLMSENIVPGHHPIPA